MQLRQCEIVQDKDKLKVDIQAVCMKYTTIKQWAYILHDKDDTRPHYHIYLNFGTSSLDTATIAKWFSLGYEKDGKEYSGEQFVGKIRYRKTSALMYLTHENETQKYKHIYDRSEVTANFDFGSEIDQSKIIGNFEHFSYAQQLGYVNSLPIAEKAKAYSQLRKLWELYCQCETLKSERNLEVVFICGKGGTGKTFYAKKMLTNLGYDFCISSSSNTNSSVRSRFNNKVFNGKMIVITSSVPLVYWYPMCKFRHDSLEQLYRRIGSYVEVTETSVTVYGEGVGTNGKPQGLGRIFRNEVQDFVKQPSVRTDLTSVFEGFCDELSPGRDDVPF